MRYILTPIVLFLFAFTAYAGIDDITFPIDELGGCESEAACFSYCESPDNYDACMAFAADNGLAEEEEIEQYEQVKEALNEGGPGGCDSHESCESYCSVVENLDECIAFGEEHGIMDDVELEEARKVQQALEGGAQLPGGCTGKDACEAYCEDPANMEECFAFAQAVGFIDEEEAEEAQAAMELMQSGETPGGCTSHESCEAYCEDPANMDECLDFGVKAGFMSQEEADHIKEQGEMFEDHGDRPNIDEDGNFVGPGGCLNEECQTYCSDPENDDECREFFGEPEEHIDMEGEYHELPEGDEFEYLDEYDKYEEYKDHEPPEGHKEPEMYDYQDEWLHDDGEYPDEHEPYPVPEDLSPEEMEEMYELYKDEMPYDDHEEFYDEMMEYPIDEYHEYEPEHEYEYEPDEHQEYDEYKYEDHEEIELYYEEDHSGSDPYYYEDDKEHEPVEVYEDHYYEEHPPEEGPVDAIYQAFRRVRNIITGRPINAI